MDVQSSGTKNSDFNVNLGEEGETAPELEPIMNPMELSHRVTGGELDSDPQAKYNEMQALEFSEQADIWQSEFERTGTVESIDEAVKLRNRALSITPEEHVGRANQLTRLGILLYYRFGRLGAREDVDRAIEYHSQAVQLTPDGHGIKPGRLNCLGISYIGRFERLDEIADMNKGIKYLTQALLLTADNDENKPAGLNNLGNSYARRFERLGEIADLNKAIEYLTEAVLLIADNDAKKPAGLNNLGNTYARRFKRLGELADVDKAIECQTQAVFLTPDGHPGKPGWLDNLGNAYAYRFERLGEVAEMNKAVECQTQAVLLTPDDHADKPSRLNNLGTSYQSRFERFGELEDVAKAIECQSQAVLLTPDGHPDKPSRLSNLGYSYQCRFKRLGELADLNKAVERQTQAVLLTPDDHADKPSRLNNLGIAYQSRFERLGEVADVDKAIEWKTQAALLTPDNHVDKPSRLHNLGSSYLRRFERLGALVDVDKAIEYQAQAASLAPDDHVDKPSWLNNLGVSYQSRFERLRELMDIAKAIECKNQAVLLTPDRHPDKPSRLNNLGISYQSRFERLGEVADVDKAIEYQTTAMLLAPDGHARKPGWLNNLGISYRCRFERLGEFADVNKAIEYHTQAVLLTPDGHAYKPSLLCNLGSSYRSRFERLGELADLDKAIEYHTQAVLLTPDGHANNPVLLHKIGAAYMHRFQSLHQRTDLQSALSSFQSAAQHVVGDPSTQVRCAREWAKHSSALDFSPLQAYEMCMELIPRVIWLGSTITQRYELLDTVSDLASEAAAWAISVQDYDLAIEWLEQGRSIVWSQILQLRTPVDDLAAVDHVLAKSLKSVAARLEGAGTRRAETSSTNNTLSPLEQEAQSHRRLAAEWDTALAKARTIPGFESFMRPRKAAELKRSATDGPIVLINTHSKRSDALIIFPKSDNILHLSLANLSLDKAAGFREELYNSVRHRGDDDLRYLRLTPAHRPKDSFKRMLVDLWSTIVHPVLDALSCTRQTSADELPHITWCATGALGFLPLHAAGPYDGSSPNACDLAIASYTPTLSALLASSTTTCTSDVGVLGVGQLDTRGFPHLPSTVQELAAIEMQANSIRYHRLDGQNATVDAVLGAMDEYTSVHLACHASQNLGNPVHSAFHLHDGSLTLETITKRQFKNKGLAFLSACQTATGDDKLPDEAVHLAAGMLMAGYPSVIATMWPMCDEDGPEVAERVYAELLKDGKMDHRGAARALHKAVVGLREKIGEDSFKRWVPFIHIGV